MNKFRFMNVGQGLFYHGRIGDFNFVYDCGSTSPLSNQYLNNCIQSEFLPKEDIEYVFISHLDKDHINGYNLLRRYANVKRLILPYLGNDRLFVYLFLMCLCDEDDELFQHIYGQYLEFNQSYEVDENNLAERMMIYEEKWVFNCFSKSVPNSVSTAFVNDVTTLISNSLGYEVILNQSVIKQYIDYFGFDYIKALYKKHFRKMNATSMCLLHHPCNDYENISLLTGDAVFDLGMLQYVNEYLNDHIIRYFQVPHHGAIKEWHLLNGLEKKCLVFYISFGLGNRYTHPSSQVIRDIIAMGKNPNLAYQSNAPYFYNNEYYI